MFYWIVKILTYIPFKIIYPTRVIGKKNLIRGSRMILAPNHQTLNDPIIIYSNLGLRLNFMAKAPLFDHKPMAYVLNKLGAYPVHNGKNDLTAVKHTLRLLKDDKPVVIFPEGMRIKSDVSNEIKHGVANFAIKTETPIVPAVFVRFTNAFVPNTLIIGKPFDLFKMEEFSGPINHEKLESAGAIISKSIYELKDEYTSKKIAKAKKIYLMQICDLYDQMYKKQSKSKLKNYDKVARPYLQAISDTITRMNAKVKRVKKRYRID